MYIEMKQILKKFPSNRINSTKKNPLSFFAKLQPTQLITAVLLLIFNLKFLYELKHKPRLSKTMCGILFGFYWSLCFCLTKCMDSNKIIPFKIIITELEKPHTGLLPGIWFLVARRSFKIQWLQEFGVPQKLTWSKSFNPKIEVLRMSNVSVNV